MCPCEVLALVATVYFNVRLAYRMKDVGACLRLVLLDRLENVK